MRTLLKRDYGALFALAIALVTSLAAAAQTAPGQAPAATPATATPPVSAVPELSAQDVQAWLDGYMPYALKRGGIAGAVVVVVKDGQVLVQKGYGTSDVATEAPVDPQTTLFRPGSVSKLFTWTAVMQMVEQGRIDLDRDVNTYLDFVIPPYQGKPVTMRNLMTHTAGFQETSKNLIFAEPAPEPALDAYLKQNLPDRIFPPGVIPSYSNYGATLAGYIVQRVSGEKFADYIDHHIFAPLDMHYASFRQPLPAALKPLMSQGYSTANDPAKPFEVVGPAPAGSSSVSGANMAHFMIAHLQDGAYQGQRILQQATAQMMHTAALNNIPPLNSMLLGFYQMNRNGHRIIGHAGDTQWFHSELTLFLDDHVGLFISMNSVGVDGAAGPLRQGLREAFTDRYFPAQASHTKQDAAAAQADNARISGTYVTSRREETTFFSLVYYLLEASTVGADANGELTAGGIKTLASQPQHFDSVAPLLWRASHGKMRLGAKRLGNGLIWTDDESPYEVFTPVPWFKNAAWLKPALIASVISLLLTGLFWPVTALFRRRYNGVLSLRGAEKASYRLTRAAALLDGLLMAFWPVVIVVMLQTFALNGSFDQVILTMHWLTIIIFPLALVIFIWNAWVVWSRRRGLRGLFARVWSVVLVAAGTVLVWCGAVFHLIGTSLAY
jgi:CubicO group peptidase (beta-lactamase class C family)